MPRTFTCHELPDSFLLHGEINSPGSSVSGTYFIRIAVDHNLDILTHAVNST
ncbi:hypothetical protein [Catenisphaera adipataccumulans]|uniref:hypothetical protein n=1 Tax=Catenisphaera adipataccumulans TaxID=700500 RepID=UPI001619DA23|nr:hypothetical protein [Catenisphaera adipataccumulans]